MFFHFIAAHHFVNIIPAVGAKSVVQQGRADFHGDLLARHARAQGEHGVGIQRDALHHGKFVIRQFFNQFGRARAERGDGGDGEKMGFQGLCLS